MKIKYKNVLIVFFFSNLLPIDRYGSEPLCMDQYKKLIGTCRIPGKTIDQLYLYNKTGHHHVAVFYRNNVRENLYVIYFLLFFLF